MHFAGITSPISWNNAACSYIDKSLSFIEEERLTRVKQAPHVVAENALAQVLGDKTINSISIGFRQPLRDPKKTDLIGNPHQYDYLLHAEEFYASKLVCTLSGKFGIKNFKFVDHQFAHLMSAVAQNHYKTGLAISVDGWGGSYSGSVARFNGTELKILENLENQNSLGIFYSEFTKFCGLISHTQEGQLMGMSALSDEIIELPEDLFDTTNNLPIASKVSEYVKKLDPVQTLEEKARIANTAQYYLERAMLSMIERHISDFDQSIMLAGGVALNCTCNGKISERWPDKFVLAQPASQDAGTAFGAMAHTAFFDHQTKLNFISPYTGRDISETLIEWPTPPSLSVHKIDTEHIVDLLGRGKIIAVAWGRDEVGPRALCNRSLIASSHLKAAKEKLNKIKRRQNWRPVAPVTTEELLHLLVSDLPNADLRFMNIACKASESFWQKSWSGVHLDGSIRPQVIPFDHPMSKIIKLNYENTGSAALLNTSFNIGNEPIVSSFEDAIRTFSMSNDIDALLVADALYIRN